MRHRFCFSWMLVLFIGASIAVASPESKPPEATGPAKVESQSDSADPTVTVKSAKEAKGAKQPSETKQPKQPKQPIDAKQPRQPKQAKEPKATPTDADSAAKAEKDAPKAAAKDDAKTDGTAKTAAAKKTDTATAVKPKVVRFILTGDYPEGPTDPGLFGELSPSLAKVVERLDDAAEDDSVAAVWLRIEVLQMGLAKIDEIRAAIGRVRAAGKPVFAELNSAETSQYLLASACDKIIMPPPGLLVLPGLHAEMLFFKGMLDKIGVQFQSIQMGKYKGAAEQFTRTEMSEPLRESFVDLVDRTYCHLAGEIAEARGMQEHAVKTLMDKAFFTAQAAHRAGLVDQVTYADQFDEAIAKHLKVPEIELVTDYKKQKVDTDFSGIAGFMKLMELMMGGKAKARSTAKKKIAIVYAVGMIHEGKSESDLFGSTTVGSTTLVKALQDADEDESVVAIVLRIDSPGGSAVASDLIWRETVRTQKPIVASMGDVAASGGYYIAMGADKIFADPNTVTGSIGVIGGKFVLGGMFEKLGVTTEVISRGELSGTESLTEPFSANERRAITALMREIYKQFVDKAAKGRNMPREKMEELAQGRIYAGSAAKELGLIDGLGTLEDALAEAKKAAGLDPDEEVDTLVLPKPQSFFEQLFGGESISGGIDTEAAIDVAAPAELRPLLMQVRVWRKILGRERAVLALPCHVRLR